METHTSVFLKIPSEVLVDLLSILDTKSVFQFYATSSTHRGLFNTKDGLWQDLSSKLHLWSAADARQLDNFKIINWKKEYLISSVFDSKIRGAELTHNNYKPRPTLLKRLAKNHFSIENANNNEFGVDYTHCALQAPEPLYPLPVGNLSISYYEVEVLRLGEFDFAVGAAQDGYVGYVGIGRDSYAFSSDNTNGIIYLSSEFVSSELPSHPLNTGDTIGFGIDFSNKSVFWTKNGQLIYETKLDALGNPIRNLKSMHATVSMDNYEIKANFGERPFEFDILVYQKKNTSGKMPRLNLYHKTIQPHLCSFMDLESLEDKKAKFNMLASDRNPPKFPVEISPLMYMLAYSRDHPQGQLTIEEDAYIQLETCRALINGMQRLLEMKEPTKTTIKFLSVLATLFEVPNYEEKSWQEKVITLNDLATTHVANLMDQLIHLTIDSTAQCAFIFENWAMYVICLHCLVLENVPDVQHQAALNWLRLEFDAADATDQEIMQRTFTTVVSLRASTIENVANKRCVEIIKQKTQEFAQLSKLYGTDALFKKNTAKMFKTLNERVKEVPQSIDKKIAVVFLLHRITLRRKPAPVGQAVSSVNILCGVYKYEMSPEQYPSTEKFLDAVEQKMSEEVTPELLAEFLKWCKDTAKNEQDDEWLERAVATLNFYGADVPQGRSMAELRAVVSKLDKPLKKPVLVSDMAKGNAKQAVAGRSTGMTVGIIVGLALGLLGAFILRKKFK